MKSNKKRDLKPKYPLFVVPSNVWDDFKDVSATLFNNGFQVISTAGISLHVNHFCFRSRDYTVLLVDSRDLVWLNHNYQQLGIKMPTIIRDVPSVMYSSSFNSLSAPFPYMGWDDFCDSFNVKGEVPKADAGFPTDYVGVCLSQLTPSREDVSK